MVIVEAKGRLLYVSAVLTDMDRAGQYVAGLSRELAYIHDIVDVPEISEFPFYIVEERVSIGHSISGKKNTFQYVTDLHSFFSNAGTMKRYIIYFVTGEFRPAVPGTDDMGMLRHVHIGPEELEDFQQRKTEMIRRLFNLSPA